MMDEEQMKEEGREEMKKCGKIGSCSDKTDLFYCLLKNDCVWQFEEGE